MQQDTYYTKNNKRTAWYVKKDRYNIGLFCYENFTDLRYRTYSAHLLLKQM